MRIVYLSLLILLSSNAIAQTPYIDIDEQIEYEMMLDEYIQDITITKDKYSSKVTYSTPATKNFSLYPVRFFRVDEGEVSRIYMLLKANGTDVSAGVTGVDMLFTNGEIYNLPDKDVDVDVPAKGSRYWRYESTIMLTQEMIESLKNSLIDSYRLYVYDFDLNDTAAKEIQSYFRAILTFYN
jgi:hypothetical protein